MTAIRCASSGSTTSGSNEAAHGGERQVTASPEEMIPGFELRPAWRLRDSQIEADAIEFWTRLKLLPRDVRPLDRAKELIAVVYKDDQIVGVHTATIERVKQVRARLAMLRSAVDPEFRRTHISWAL